MRRTFAVVLLVVIGCPGPENSGHLTIDSPPADQPAFTQPLAIVKGDGFEGLSVSATWENTTTGTSGPAHVDTYERCLVIVCQTVVRVSAAVPLAPGSNHVRVTARDVEGNWGSDEIDLSFAPESDRVGVGILATTEYPDLPVVYLRGEGTGLVALQWRNDVTDASGEIQGETYSCQDFLFTNLTQWSGCVPLAGGVNRITVRGTGWTGAVVEDSIEVVSPP